MSDSKSEGVQEIAAKLPSQVFRPKALTIIVAFVAGGVVLGSLAVFAQGRIDGGVAPLAAELAQHKSDTTKRIDQVQADVAAVKRQLESSEERSARRFEVLYNTILERRPQPGADELTKPQTDGGR